MKGHSKGNHYTKKKIKYLNMINGGKAKKNSSGDIVRAAVFQKTTRELARVESVRYLFNDTKTVTQNELDAYRDSVQTKSPYEVLLSTGNVPYSIINNEVKKNKHHSFEGSFGTKSVPRRPKLNYTSLEEMKSSSDELKAKIEAKNRAKEGADQGEEYFGTDMNVKNVKGQSKRIWNELYKVLDSSDVIVHVLDARDPIGTRCDKIEEYVREQAKHKHLIYVLNKVDLVPTAVTAKWLRVLSKVHPAIAFHSNSLENNYGRTNLTNLIRQLKTLYDKQAISVGFVGYPNTGKSSIINAMRDKKVCKVAPVPGETKVWQYITLTKEIYLIDSPGVVPVPDHRQAVMKGAIRIENLDDADTYIADIIGLAGKAALERTYAVNFADIDEFFVKMSKAYGKVSKGGEPNIDLISKIVLHDWVRGKIPFFVEPVD